MSPTEKVYYLALILILFAGIGWQVFPKLIPAPSGQGQFMAVNASPQPDGSCKLYWLGGTDYDSFVTILVVDGKNIGHPLPGSEIYHGPNCNATVKMYMRDVRTLKQIHPSIKNQTPINYNSYSNLREPT